MRSAICICIISCLRLLAPGSNTHHPILGIDISALACHLYKGSTLQSQTQYDSRPQSITGPNLYLLIPIEFLLAMADPRGRIEWKWKLACRDTNVKRRFSDQLFISGLMLGTNCPPLRRVTGSPSPPYAVIPLSELPRGAGYDDSLRAGLDLWRIQLA